MALTEQQQAAIKRIKGQSEGMIPAQEVSREQMRNLIGVQEMQEQAKGPSSFFDRTKERFKGAAERVGTNITEIAKGEMRGEQGRLRSGFQAAGQLLSGGAEFVFGTLIDAGIPQFIAEPAKEQAKKILNTSVGKMGVEALQAGVEAWDDFSAKNPVVARDLSAVAGFLELIPGTKLATRLPGVAGDVAKSTLKGGVDIGKKVASRVFDKTKGVEERLSALKQTIGKTADTAKDVAGEVAGEVPKKSFIKKTTERFTENPNITGAIDDIKVMVGLPESTPASDLTFRAIKPRITKGKDLQRIKSQMNLANETIVQKGFKPTTVREYAEAIYDTKKQVWSEIESKLTSEIAQGAKINLKPITEKLIEMAEDTALLRTSPNASKQITEIAENLIQYGDDVDIVEAERIKQLINSELEGSFGSFELSQHAKNAKKEITGYIGEQLNDILSDLPDEFKDLKIKYGSLSAIDDDVWKRVVVFERQNPEGLADMLSKTEAAVEMALGGPKGIAKGLARLTMQSRLKKANDANELVKRAFEKMGETGLPQAGK